LTTSHHSDWPCRDALERQRQANDLRGKAIVDVATELLTRYHKLIREEPMVIFEISFSWPGVIYVEAKDEDEAHEKFMQTAADTSLYNTASDNYEMEDPEVKGCWEVADQ
jgi:hypothetical protein